MRLQPIVERLEAEVSGLTSVDGIAGLALIAEQPGRPPLAFVAPVSERAADNQRVGSAHRQVVTVATAVVLILPGHARQRGQVSEALEEYSTAVKRALTGWQHPDAIAALSYRTGRLLRASAGQIAWQMNFETRQQEATP